MSSHTPSGSLTREVLDAIPLSTATLDRDGVIVDTNRAWREFAAENGITESQDYVGVSYLAVTEAATRKAEDGDAERAAVGLRSVLTGDCERFTMEYPCHSPTERQWFRLLATPLTTRDGRFVVVTHRDVTDRVLAERRAERQHDEMVEERERLSLVNQILRHDVRNDLNLVTGWLGLLDAHVGPEGEEILQRVSRATGHTLELVEAAGDFAELVGESSDSLAPIDVSTVLVSEVEKLRAAYADRPTSLTVTGPESRDSDVEVLATPLLSSVFSNLLNNAVFHNDKADVRIEVTFVEREGTVVVSVADNGSGIPDDRKERLFDQGEKRAESSGLGLGLYLVETLVRFYGGSVWVEDADPDGAVFCVELRRP